MPVFDRVATDMPVLCKNDDYTVSTQDFGCEFEFNKATAVVCRLPAATSVGNGYNVCLRNIGAGALTIDPDGTEQIDGASTLVITQGNCHWIRCDGKSWRTFAICKPPSSGGGKVLQVMSGELNTAISTTSTTMTASGLNVSITPAATANKILLSGQLCCAHSSSGVMHWQIKETVGNTVVWPTPSSPGNRTASLSNLFLSESGLMLTQSFQCLLSPSTTSALTYEIYYLTNSAGQPSYINRDVNYTDAAATAATSSSITAMEIED